jgi:hypothetical protein
MGETRPSVRMLSRAVVWAVLVAALAPWVASAQVESTRLHRVLRALSDPSYKVRLQAAMALGHLKDARAVPALVTSLEDPNPLVRGMAANALGLIGDTRAVAPLREHLKDRESLVRRNAQASLDRIRKLQAPRPPKPRGTSASPRAPVLLRLGGMGDKTKRGGPLLQQLRRIWTERIEHTPSVRLAAGSGSSADRRVYEVSSAITELSLHRRGKLVETTCSVSVVLGDHRGTIVMMTSGGATVQVESRGLGSAGAAAMQTTALEGAVASAHSNLLKFLATPPLAGGWRP